MAIYLRCPFCKTDQNVRSKVCRKCGKPLPQRSKTYRVVVKHNGRVVTKHIPNSLELARQIETKIKSELISGEYYDRRKQAKEQISFNVFMTEKYLPYAQSNKVSWVQEEILFRLWIKPVIGDKCLKDVSQFDIERLKKNMNDAGKAPKTINYAIDVIRMAFNMAIRWGLIENNPAVGVKRPKKDNRRTRFLTPEEAQKLLNECKHRSQQLYEIAFLSLHTGMRFGEIANLKWQDIDFENELIQIKDPKNATNRIAYMTSEIKAMLKAKEQGEPNKLVFKSRKGGKIQTISMAFNEAVKALGLNDGVKDSRDKVVFHTLRHTFASWLAIQGTPIYTIKELLGHKSLAMTERYSHLLPGVKREAVKGIEKIFLDNTIGQGSRDDLVNDRKSS